MLTAAAPWGHVQRPWGYEIRVDFTADDGAIHNGVLTFPAKPSGAELDKAVAIRAGVVKARLALIVPVAEPEITSRGQVEALTRQVATLTAENLRLRSLLTPAVIVR